MMVNFGLSHTMWGLSKRQNLALVLYAMIIFIPTVYKVMKKELVFSTDNFLSLSGIIWIYIYTHIMFTYMNNVHIHYSYINIYIFHTYMYIYSYTVKEGQGWWE